MSRARSAPTGRLLRAGSALEGTGLPRSGRSGHPGPTVSLAVSPTVFCPVSKLLILMARLERFELAPLTGGRAAQTRRRRKGQASVRYRYFFPDPTIPRSVTFSMTQFAGLTRPPGGGKQLKEESIIPHR
jgi:hypothetical protein